MASRPRVAVGNNSTMTGVGDDPQTARDALEALFKAIPKSRQGEHLGDLNEVLVYIDRHRVKSTTK